MDQGGATLEGLRVNKRATLSSVHGPNRLVQPRRVTTRPLQLNHRIPLARVRRGLAQKRARFLLGEIYFDKGDLFKAEEQYAAIVAADSRSADAHFFLGEVYAKMNDPVKARAEWRTALIIDPSHYGARLRYYGGRR